MNDKQTNKKIVKRDQFWYTDYVKEFYIIIQSNASICKTFKVISD